MSVLLASLLSWEALAVVLALAYLLLAARESLWCWLCAFISSVLYVWLMYRAQLYMETALNVFYAVMAVVGWWSWRQGTQGSALAIKRLPWQGHVLCVVLSVVLALVNGYLMQRFTNAAWPFVDSFITWASVITTFLVVRKYIDNWLYWVVIDGLAVVVYLERGLYLTALLFAAYVVIVGFGYWEWVKRCSNTEEC